MRDSIVQSGESYQKLLASGIKDADIRDGSLAAGRIEYCGGPNESGTALTFFVPVASTSRWATLSR
jgi:hypothetical protein